VPAPISCFWPRVPSIIQRSLSDICCTDRAAARESPGREISWNDVGGRTFAHENVLVRGLALRRISAELVAPARQRDARSDQWRRGHGMKVSDRDTDDMTQNVVANPDELSRPSGAHSQNG
jgi:hypothetical protein